MWYVVDPLFFGSTRVPGTRGPQGSGAASEVGTPCKPTAWSVETMSIVSGSMSCTFRLVGEQRFEVSFSRNRVPINSHRALLNYTVCASPKCVLHTARTHAAHAALESAAQQPLPAASHGSFGRREVVSRAQNFAGFWLLGQSPKIFFAAEPRGCLRRSTGACQQPAMLACCKHWPLRVCAADVTRLQVMLTCS